MGYCRLFTTAVPVPAKGCDTRPRSPEKSRMQARVIWRQLSSARIRRCDMRRLVILGLSSVLVGACGILGPDTETRIGDLYIYIPEELVIVVPDSVAVGQEFTVVVHTRGGGCIKFHSTRVDMDGNVATITAYDTFTLGVKVCTADIASISHEATIRFTRRGQATILFRVYSPGAYRLSRTVRVY